MVEAAQSGTEAATASPRAAVIGIMAGDGVQIGTLLDADAPVSVMIDPLLKVINSRLVELGEPALQAQGRGRWVLSLVDGTILRPAQSLTEQDVYDGDRLWLRFIEDQERRFPVIEHISTAVSVNLSKRFASIDAAAAVRVGVATLSVGVLLATGLLAAWRFQHDTWLAAGYSAAVAVLTLIAAALTLVQARSVAGYEIMNEPWVGSSWLSALFGNAHFGAQQLTPFYNQLDSAIRSVDPTTPVLFEPNPLVGSLPAQTHLGTVDDPHSIYSFHNYCIATTLIPSLSATCDLNADIVTGNADAYAGAHGIPALMTEFGATDNTQTISAGMDAANQHRYGWLEWAYTGHDITSSSPNDQALVFDPSKPPVGDNVDTAKLATLAEPYPQAIAGTPNSWSFQDGTFQLSYSTERADGLGDFAGGAQTTISVPNVEYPNGYQVSVTGGHVVSAADAPVLVVASDPGAHTVNVVVSPANG